MDTDNTTNTTAEAPCKLVVAVNPSLMELVRSTASTLGIPLALAVHQALGMWQTLGVVKAATVCPDYQPWREIARADAPGQTFHGCGYDASPGGCPFRGDLSRCGERG